MNAVATRSTRAELLAEYELLLDVGWSKGEIAEHFGKSPTSVRNLFADPDGAKQHRRRLRYSGRCVDCGCLTDGSNGAAKAPERCESCARPYYARIWSAERRGTGHRVEAVLALLAQRPHRYAEIRDALGVSSAHAGVLLNRLVKYGLVVRPERGLYALVEPTAEEVGSPSRSTEASG